ncbi:MAG TPA: LptF/LptG family permease [Gemmatimonadales bacterium]|nr:LptF/LptG family permease [Gemmatimonadales bacterium]
MRLLSRYLLRQLAGPFAFALSALTGLLLLNQVAKRFGDLVGKGLPPNIIAEVLFLFLPFIVALTLPMAVLVAVLYGFSHLAADNEITAMRASGVSVTQMLRPVFIAGVAVALFNFLFIDQVLPRSNARLRTLQMDIGRIRPTLAMKEQIINQLPPTEFFIRSVRIEQGTGRLRNVTIYDLSLPTTRRIVYADSGRMMMESGGTTLRLVLYDGKVHEYRPEEQGTVRVTRFAVNTIRARDVANALERSTEIAERGDREMSVCQMVDKRAGARLEWARVHQQRENYTRKDVRSILRLMPEEPRILPTVQDSTERCGIWRKVEKGLGKYIFPSNLSAQQGRPGGQAGRRTDTTTTAVRRASPPARLSATMAPVILSGLSEVSEAKASERSEMRQANMYGVEIHKKFTISVSCFNFVIIGIALALRFPRGGMGLVLGGSLIIFAVFYIAMTSGEQLADRGYLTPAAAMWAPNLLIGTLGILGLWAASRNTGSTRGGDLADLGDLLFGWLRRRKSA